MGQEKEKEREREREREREKKKERGRERERLNFDDGPTFCESEMVRKKSSEPERVFL